MANPTAEWFIDSGCSHHQTWNPALFQNLTPLFFPRNSRVANGSLLIGTHKGDIGSHSNELFIPNAYLVPNLKANLLSVGQLCNQGARFTFSSSGCIIEDRSGHVVGRGHKAGNHFILDELNMSRPQEMASETNSSRKQAQRNAALDSVTSSSETNNKRRLSITEVENFAIQTIKVPQLEAILRWIESELQRHQIIWLNTTCANCLDSDEDIRHLLFTCPFARMCWFISPLALKSDCVTGITFHDFLDFFLETQGEDIWNSVACIVWSIWRCRNEMAYAGKTPNAQRFQQILREVTAQSVLAKRRRTERHDFLGITYPIFRP